MLGRTIKILIRDGLSFLLEDSSFSEIDIKKCIVHYLTEIFRVEDKQDSKKIWNFLTDQIRKKYQVTIERDSLSKLHIPMLLKSISKNLKIKLSESAINTLTKTHNHIMKRFETYSSPHKPLEITLNSPKSPLMELASPKTPYPSPLLEAEDITEVGVWSKENYAYSSGERTHSISYLTERGRELDRRGKKSQWSMKGGEERTVATSFLENACKLTARICGIDNMHYALRAKELAEQLESRHQEAGRPQNSRWNRSSNIPEDYLSAAASNYYKEAIRAFRKSVSLFFCVCVCFWFFFFWGILLSFFRGKSCVWRRVSAIFLWPGCLRRSSLLCLIPFLSMILLIGILEL